MNAVFNFSLKKLLILLQNFFPHIFQSYAIKMSMYWVFSSLSNWNVTENILLNSINKIVAVEKDTCALNESDFVLLVSVVRILGRNVNFHNYFFSHSPQCNAIAYVPSIVNGDRVQTLNSCFSSGLDDCIKQTKIN